MFSRFLRNENILYAVAFILALAIRLAGSTRVPLSDGEATLAIQALALSKGQQPFIQAQPAYLFLTTIFMFLFGGANWVPRFWPALAGSVLVLCPALFKSQIGKIPALFLSFLLVVDPAMLAISQHAGSIGLAIVFILLFVHSILQRKPMTAGIAGGMALLTGPDMWPGVIGIGLASFASWRLGFWENKTKSKIDASIESPKTPIADFEWRLLLYFLLGTIFFGGTLFFFFPRGLSAMAGGLAGYLQGWVKASGIPALYLLLSLFVYEFLLLFLGVWGVVAGLVKKTSLERFLIVWWLISFILALVYPGRQMESIVWSILPLALLAARQLAWLFNVVLDDWLPTLGQAVLSSLILGFISLTALSMVNNPQYINEREYWIRLLGAVAMLIASAALIAWGWSKEVSIYGLSLGCCLILFIYSISASWNVANLSDRAGLDFWTNKQVLPSQQLLLQTVDQITRHASAESSGYDLIVTGVQSPALEWALRDYSKVKFTSQYPTGSTPAFIISRDQPDLSFGVPYRGQEFILSRNVGWSELSAQEWLRWVGFRVVPEEIIQNEKIIFWAKTDLFPGGEMIVTEPEPGKALPAEDLN